MSKHNSNTMLKKKSIMRPLHYFAVYIFKSTIITYLVHFRFMVLYHGTVANKLFSTPKIILAFMLLLSLEMCFHTIFALYNLTGPTNFVVCGIFFDRNSPKLAFFYQTNVGFVLIAYGLSIYFGLRVVRKIREHSANVSESFVVRLLYGSNFSQVF